VEVVQELVVEVVPVRIEPEQHLLEHIQYQQVSKLVQVVVLSFLLLQNKTLQQMELHLILEHH
tara:strand:+ start:582 stop:770 length:189 start_codon:yes stop_codon:yes gene_type:complete